MKVPAALPSRSIQSVLECFAGLELGLAGGGDGHRLARPRVAGLSCRAGSDRERAEARQPDLVTSLQRVGDGREQAIDRLLGIALAEPAIAGDGGDQLASVHGRSSIKVVGPYGARIRTRTCDVKDAPPDLLQLVADDTRVKRPGIRHSREPWDPPDFLLIGRIDRVSAPSAGEGLTGHLAKAT